MAGEKQNQGYYRVAQFTNPLIQTRLLQVLFINQSMEEQVKLLIGTSLDGVDQEFFIYRNTVLGEGGFGIVRRAIEGKNKGKPLAVKIIPYGRDEVKRVKIQREIAILRLLPEHQNLVKVLPYKCFSENNFYIFMELCPDGTLTSLVRKPGLLQQQTIFSIFYQLMSGYRVLWEAKIVHQDLKLANVLIKKGVLKITDFGFSILAENYKTTLTREGTLHYMPYEKLTDPNYVADQLSDIYSLGVMMFEVITKMHPYVNQKSIKSQKDFVIALRAANIARPKLYATYSLQLQKLYDLVVRMCAKSQKNRIDCIQIYDYLDSQQIFAQYREKKVQPSVEFELPPLPMKIEEVSTPVFLPFLVEPEEEKDYIDKIKREKQNRISEAYKKSIEKVQNWVLGFRLVLYFFDRLSRRLQIQKIKEELAGDAAHSYNRAVLSCLAFEKRLAKQILKELKTVNLFTGQQLQSFKTSEVGAYCIKLIKKDEEYTQQSINDHLKRTRQVEVKDLKQLIDLSEDKNGLPVFLGKVKTYLYDCIGKRSLNVSDKKHLITLAYLFDAIKLIQEYPQVDGLALEGYFFATETQSTAFLTEQVMKHFEIQAKVSLPMFAIQEEEGVQEWI